ncbi:MAG: sugar ABC transporter substrate-binding protein [bacterium]|nr:sugar ABC transporter substrate-binding protein [bacterium]
MCVAALTAAAGCGKPQGTPGSPKSTAEPAQEPEKPQIALIMKSLANEFFATMEQGARDHQAVHADAFDLLVQGIKDELDINRQVQLVEQMVARGVDAIVIAPADSKALVKACKDAMDKGVVVVNIDNKLDDEVLKAKQAVIPFVGPDNRKGAALVGECLAKQLESGASVAIVGGVASAFNAIQRRLGFEDAMNAAGMKIVSSQAGDWEMNKANTVVSAIVAEHPDLQAVLCANDSMALGAVAALKDAGKLDQVRVVGFDNISAVQELVKNGAVLATADQHADQLAVFGIEYALEMLKTGAAPEDRETPVDLVTAAKLGGTQ